MRPIRGHGGRGRVFGLSDAMRGRGFGGRGRADGNRGGIRGCGRGGIRGRGRGPGRMRGGKNNALLTKNMVPGASFCNEKRISFQGGVSLSTDSSSTDSSSPFSTVHPTHEKYLNKKIEMFDEMALVVGQDRARGNFAKSFSDVNLESRPKHGAVQLNDDIDIEEISRDKEVGKFSPSSSATSSQPRQHRKRSRDTNDGEPNLQAIFEKLGEVADAISRLTGDRLNVQSLHDEILKMEGYDEAFLGSAFDYLVEHEMLGKAFMAKNNNLRRIWLENFRKK